MTTNLHQKVWQPPPTQQPNRNWIVITICLQHADANISNSKGKWKLSLWKVITENSNIELFWMAFPEKIIVDVVIPATKKLEKPMTLHEFYEWLGCQIFMTCFKCVTDCKDWWSGKPIPKQRGAPFQLNKYIRNRPSFKLLQWSPKLTRILLHLWISSTISIKCSMR